MPKITIGITELNEKFGSRSTKGSGEPYGDPLFMKEHDWTKSKRVLFEKRLHVSRASLSFKAFKARIVKTQHFD